MKQLLYYPDQITTPTGYDIVVFRNMLDGFLYYKSSDNSITMLNDEGNTGVFKINQNNVGRIFNVTSNELESFDFAGGKAIILGKSKEISLLKKKDKSKIVYIGGSAGSTNIISNGRTPVFIRETMGNANKVFTAGYTEVALIAALTAARTLTIPLANSVPAGTVISFVDEIQGASSSNTVTITRAGSDTINGATTYTIYSAGVTAYFVSDGTSKWTGGVINTGANVAITTILFMSANQQTTSSTAQNITDLIMPLAANSLYSIEGSMGIQCNNTGGVKFAITVPTGATFRVGYNGWSTSKSTFLLQEDTASGTLTTTAHCQQNNTGILLVGGVITTAGTAGNAQFKFASGVATETSTILRNGTALFITKLA